MHRVSLDGPHVTKCFPMQELHAQTHHNQTAKTKESLENSQGKMTHCLQDNFSPLMFFKICMMAKSKNDGIIGQDFQCTSMNYIDDHHIKEEGTRGFQDG